MITPAQAQPDTLILYSFLPEFVQDNDAAGGYQFLSWLDGAISEGSTQTTLTTSFTYNNGMIVPLVPPLVVVNVPVPAATGLQAIDNIIRDTPYNPGYSVLLDINRCPTYALPWLGQFVGVRFPQTQPDAVMRQAIQNESAFQRGTLGAIQSAADAQMVSPYVVQIQERTSFIADTIGYDAYSITVTYPLAGVGSLTYGQLFADYTNYEAVQEAYTTYGAMAGYTANLESAVNNAVPAGIIVYYNPF